MKDKGDEITLTEETIREAEYFGGLGVVYGLYRADPWSAKTKENGLTPEYAARCYNLLTALLHGAFKTRHSAFA